MERTDQAINWDVTTETPRLSLCIPTYNRAALLTLALDAILPQIGPEEAPQVEVLILDNASPDETPDVVAAAQRKWSHISLHCVRNAENLGPDGNFLKAIQMAHGTFVYLLSDDDILLPGAVKKLLEMIKQHPDFDAFSLNCRAFRHSLEDAGDTWLPVSEDTVLQDKSEVLRLTQTSIGFMSIMAFRKSRIAERIAAGMYADKVGTYFLQAYLFLDVLSENNGFAVTATPMLAQRAENSTRLNYFRVFVTEINALMTYAARTGYSLQVINPIMRGNLVGVRHYVSGVKIYGRGLDLWTSRREAISRLFQVYGFRPYLWLVVVPLMFFPRWLRPLVLIIRRLLGRKYIPLEDDVKSGKSMPT